MSDKSRTDDDISTSIEQLHLGAADVFDAVVIVDLVVVVVAVAVAVIIHEMQEQQLYESVINN